jgi:hypothetical protein
VIIPQRFAIDDGLGCHIANDSGILAPVSVRCSVRCPQRKIQCTSIETSSKIVGRLCQTPEPNRKQYPEPLRAVGGTFERLVSQFAGDDFL